MSSKSKNLGLLVALAAVATTGQATAQEGYKPDANDSPAMQKAEKLYYTEKRKEASEAYREVIRTEPTNAKAHQRLGAVLAAMSTIAGSEKEMKDLEETAILEEKQAIKLDAKYYLPHVVLGQLYANRHQFEDSVREFKIATDLKPTSFRSFLDLGIAYQHLNKNEDALEAYRKASEIKPESAIPHINMGVLLQSLGRFKEASEAEKKALTYKLSKEESLAANLNLGNIYADMQDADNAIGAYNSVLKIQPNHALAMSGVGWMQSVKGEYDAAIATQRKILKGVKDPVIEGVARGRLATALAAKGDTGEAEKEFEKCMKIKPPNPVTMMDYGLYLQKSGRKNEAKGLFEKALIIQPSFKPAKDALAKLDGKTQTK